MYSPGREPNFLAPCREAVYFNCSHHQLTKPAYNKASNTWSYFGFNGKPFGTQNATKLKAKSSLILQIPGTPPASLYLRATLYSNGNLDQRNANVPSATHAWAKSTSTVLFKRLYRVHLDHDTERSSLLQYCTLSQASGFHIVKITDVEALDLSRKL